VRAMESWEAIAWSAGALVAGWAIYDALWRVLEDKPAIATGLSFALLFGAAYGFTQIFSGRAAYIETGVLMGTIMTGNVWMRILPSQRSLIAATKAGKEQDATLSKRAKQRSIHNNYMTFPLLFIMLSNHFGTLYGDSLNWLLLIVVLIGGAAIRHFMNVRYAGKTWLVPAFVAGGATLGVLSAVTYLHRPQEIVIKDAVTFAQAATIVGNRCLPCHSTHNTEPMFPVAQKGVILEHPDQIKNFAPKIREVVDQRKMPFINRTNMTDEERAILIKWVDQGAKIQ